jgi:hypothetical protein
LITVETLVTVTIVGTQCRGTLTALQNSLDNLGTAVDRF